MRELTEWWKSIDGGRGTWLILGKGPTLQKLHEFDVREYRTLTLNHVVNEVEAEVASAIDIDVVAECRESIYRNARFLLMPRYPHVKFTPTDRPIESYFDELPVLRKLSDEGRLVWYNLATGKVAPGSPHIPKGTFSAEVIVAMLTLMGVRSIRTLGVDGGTAYSSRFDEKTRLANKHQSFDVQWPGIASMVRQHGVDYAPLTTEIPIRVFIGTDESQWLGVKVLQYSILKSCPCPVIFDTMEHVEVPSPKDPANQPRTEFSFKRFSIPSLCEYKGKAIYLDADMLVFRNIQELWDLPFNGARILHAPSPDPGRPKQFSVLLMNCAELRWNLAEIVKGLDERRYDYDALMKELCIEPAEGIRSEIPMDWNSLEQYVPGKTALIHYTDMHTQPWVRHRTRNGEPWVQYLLDAIQDGFIKLKDIRQAVTMGYARPSLPIQLKLSKRYWPLFNWLLAPLLDVRFKPHRKLKTRLKETSARAKMSSRLVSIAAIASHMC